MISRHEYCFISRHEYCLLPFKNYWVRRRPGSVPVLRTCVCSNVVRATCGVVARPALTPPFSARAPLPCPSYPLQVLDPPPPCCRLQRRRPAARVPQVLRHRKLHGNGPRYATHDPIPSRQLNPTHLGPPPPSGAQPTHAAMRVTLQRCGRQYGIVHVCTYLIFHSPTINTTTQHSSTPRPLPTQAHLSRPPASMPTLRHSRSPHSGQRG